ncbi:hypothetical protein ScPMuIL_008814 [Solemya velum]
MASVEWWYRCTVVYCDPDSYPSTEAISSSLELKSKLVRGCCGATFGENQDVGWEQLGETGTYYLKSTLDFTMG